MATTRLLVCKRCGPSRLRSTLFDALLAQARGAARPCSRCGARVALRLTFEFGLNASHSECTVLDCFVPQRPRSWRDRDGSRVRFYPFLVILRRHGRGLAAWLPYWHTVEKAGRKPVRKYGQWATFMDSDLFEDLLAQARAKGYLQKARGGRAAIGRGGGRARQQVGGVRRSHT
jgi:hypothetical protein